MQFKQHVLIGFTASYILIHFFNFTLLSGLIIFLSSWLIDIDHYFWYALSTKNWNPLNAIRWYKKSIPKWMALSLREREKFKRGIFICHSLIFWIILAALSFLSPFFLLVLIGVAIHMIADWIDLVSRGEPLYNKMFPCYVIRRNKNKKGLKEL